MIRGLCRSHLLLHDVHEVLEVLFSIRILELRLLFGIQLLKEFILLPFRQFRAKEFLQGRGHLHELDCFVCHFNKQLRGSCTTSLCRDLAIDLGSLRCADVLPFSKLFRFLPDIDHRFRNVQHDPG